MDGMWWFIVGIVIGGLALWIFMRERITRLEIEAEAAARGTVPGKDPAPASAPPPGEAEPPEA